MRIHFVCLPPTSSFIRSELGKGTNLMTRAFFIYERSGVVHTKLARKCSSLELQGTKYIRQTSSSVARRPPRDPADR